MGVCCSKEPNSFIVKKKSNQAIIKVCHENFKADIKDIKLNDTEPPTLEHKSRRKKIGSSKMDFERKKSKERARKTTINNSPCRNSRVMRNNMNNTIIKSRGSSFPRVIASLTKTRYNLQAVNQPPKIIDDIKYQIRSRSKSMRNQKIEQNKIPLLTNRIMASTKNFNASILKRSAFILNQIKVKPPNLLKSVENKSMLILSKNNSKSIISNNDNKGQIIDKKTDLLKINRISKSKTFHQKSTSKQGENEKEIMSKQSIYELNKKISNRSISNSTFKYGVHKDNAHQLPKNNLRIPIPSDKVNSIGKFSTKSKFSQKNSIPDLSNIDSPLFRQIKTMKCSSNLSGINIIRYRCNISKTPSSSRIIRELPLFTSPMTQKNKKVISIGRHSQFNNNNTNPRSELKKTNFSMLMENRLSNYSLLCKSKNSLKRNISNMAMRKVLEEKQTKIRGSTLTPNIVRGLVRKKIASNFKQGRMNTPLNSEIKNNQKLANCHQVKQDIYFESSTSLSSSYSQSSSSLEIIM